MSNALISYSDEELRKELERRWKAREAGRCDVCDEWYDTPTCGSDRHGRAHGQWHRRWKVETGSSYTEVFKGGVRVTISRYGDRVTAFVGGRNVMETTLPSVGAPDQEQIEWVVDWAESHWDEWRVPYRVEMSRRADIQRRNRRPSNERP